MQLRDAFLEILPLLLPVSFDWLMSLVFVLGPFELREVNVANVLPERNRQ